MVGILPCFAGPWTERLLLNRTIARAWPSVPWAGCGARRRAEWWHRPARRSRRTVAGAVPDGPAAPAPGIPRRERIGGTAERPARIVIGRANAPSRPGRKAVERSTGALREVFGFEGFRPGQEAVIEALLHGRHALTVMPTGNAATASRTRARGIRATRSSQACLAPARRPSACCGLDACGRRNRGSSPVARAVSVPASAVHPGPWEITVASEPRHT